MRAIKLAFWTIGFVISLTKAMLILILGITWPMFVSWILIRPMGIGQVDWLFCLVIYYTLFCMLTYRKLW